MSHDLPPTSHRDRVRAEIGVYCHRLDHERRQRMLWVALVFLVVLPLAYCVVSGADLVGLVVVVVFALVGSLAILVDRRPILICAVCVVTLMLWALGSHWGH